MINQEHITLLFKALDCLETQAGTEKVMQQMMIAMFCKTKDEYEKVRTEMMKETAGSDVKAHQLKLKIAEVRVELSKLGKQLDEEYLAGRDLIDGVDK